MQLLMLLALIAMGGGDIFNSVKPLLENSGDENIKSALNEASAIADALNAVKSFMPAPPKNEERRDAEETAHAEEINFPFAAVADFADKDLICALSGYLDEGART